VPAATTSTHLQLVAPQVVNVHQTGGSTVPLILVVAIVTPLVTGVFLWWNTGRQIRSQETQQQTALDAEHSRLALTLKDERERLQERQSFERGETDRMELRSILDALADNLGETYRGALTIVTIMIKVDPRADHEHDGEFGEAVREAAKSIQRANEEVYEKLERLKLRLGSSGDALVESASQANAAATTLQYAALTYPAMHSTSSDRISNAMAQFRLSRQAFLAEALKITKAQLHESALPE